MEDSTNDTTNNPEEDKPNEELPKEENTNESKPGSDENVSQSEEISSSTTSSVIPPQNANSTLINRKILKDTVMLDPGHPLLEKFQQALKEHYLKQIENLKIEILDLTVGTDKLNAEREQLGVQAYEAQQLSCSQQKILDQCVEELENVQAARAEMTIKLQEKREEQKEERARLVEVEKTSIDLQGELDSINFLIHQLTEYEKRIENNLTINQRIAEKTRKDNKRIAQEKIKQDYIIHQLRNAIWKLEKEIEMMDMQLRVKEMEREEMAQTVAVGNTNIEAMQAEYRCLMHSWQNVVVAINNRDQVLNCLSKEEEKLNDKLKLARAETQQLKKLIKKEQNENETLYMIKNRIEKDINDARSRLDEEIGKKTLLEQQCEEKQSILNQHIRDMETVQQETKEKEHALYLIDVEVKKMETIKMHIEADLLRALDSGQNEFSHSNATAIAISKIQEKNRELEIAVWEIYNKRGLLFSELESQKYSNNINKHYLDYLTVERNKLEEELRKCNAEIDKSEKSVTKKQRYVDFLNAKLEKAQQNCASAASPIDMKINSLEKQIEEANEKIKELQMFWLREQKNLLNVSKDRQKQIYQMNILRKQIMILVQKNLKVNDELAILKKHQDETHQNINKLQQRSMFLCDQLFKKKNAKVNLDKTNDIMQNSYESKLREAELESLRIHDQIAEIEKDKLTLSEDLIELNREALEWEKKLILAKEIKSTIKEESGANNEIHHMKIEIHRMAVRYNQLMKAQEKLMNDLEGSVHRRDAIFSSAEARNSREGEARVKVNIVRKMDDLKNKIKQVKNNIKQVKLDIKVLDDKIKNVKKEIESVEPELKVINKRSEDLKEFIEQVKTNKQLKFELLLIEQKKLNMFTDLSKGRKPYTVYRTEEQLTTEYMKQKELNNTLCKIIEALNLEFPKYHHEFGRVTNTLKVPIYF